MNNTAQNEAINYAGNTLVGGKVDKSLIDMSIDEIAIVTEKIKDSVGRLESRLSFISSPSPEEAIGGENNVPGSELHRLLTAHIDDLRILGRRIDRITDNLDI